MGNIYCNYTFSYNNSYSSFYKKDEIKQLNKQLLQAAGIQSEQFVISRKA